MESVTLDDVTVNFTQEEWALLKPSQKNFYRAVMQETLWNLASVGQKWQYQIIEDEYKNLNRNLRCQVLQRFFEHKENRQLGEMFIKTPNHRVNKKTSRVKQRKRHMYKEVASSPSLFPKDIIINHEHRPSEYQESTERPHECKKCDKAFKWPCDLRNHERTHTGEKPKACVQCGKTFSCSTYYRRHEQIHTGEKPLYVSNVGNPSGVPASLKYMKESTQERNLLYVSTVQKPSLVPVLFEYMKETTMERNLMCVSYVGKLSENTAKC
nr:zinc finger protein 44-like [Cavia porcellus]